MPVDLSSPDTFADRHIGPSDDVVAEMLRALGVASLEQLVADTSEDSTRTMTPSWRLT